MNRVGRFVPPNKQILRDISLGFYLGAKIGVLGLNGAGKSTLLRIIAGQDNDYTGEISRSPGYTVGLLEQEPKLDESKTVIEVVKEAVKPIVDLMARYDEVNAKFAEPERTSRRSSPSRPSCGISSTRSMPGTSRATWRSRWTRCAVRRAILQLKCCPVANVAASLSPACCSRSRTSSCSTNLPTTSTPSLWPGWSITCVSTKARSSR
jgi:energy-coupling factor transporter ATP-binding protein EcfA2